MECEPAIDIFQSSHTEKCKPEMNKQTKHYQQLTQGKRYPLYVLLKKGFSQTEIADDFGVNIGTVSRELSRNSKIDGYCPEAAERLKTKRKKTAHKSKKADEQPIKIIQQALLLGWSPENTRISMSIKMPDTAVSHTTIYRLIATDKAREGMLYKSLPRFGRSCWKGGNSKAGRSYIPDRVDITKRPEIIEQRTRIGDWEGDTVHGKDAHLVTLVDRKSRLTLITKVDDKQAETVAAKMISLLKRVSAVLTVTLDNGGEFARHGLVSEAINADIYFAKPYASYQRGTNENTLGVIRR